MATKYKPFLFERSFDEIDAARRQAANAEPEADAAEEADEAADAAEEEEAEPEAPTYSEEELEAARKSGFEEGRNEGLEAGRQEAQEDIDAQLAEAVETLCEAVRPLSTAQEAAQARSEAMTARIVRDIFARLMPVYVRRHGDDEVTGLVAECLANLQDVGKLTIRVGDGVADPMRDLLEGTVRAAGFEGKVAVIADPALDRGDALVDWGSGGAERRYDDIWADISAAVDRAIAAFDLDEPEASSAAADEAEPPSETVEDAAEELENSGSEGDAGSAAPQDDGER